MPTIILELHSEIWVDLNRHCKTTAEQSKPITTFETHTKAWKKCWCRSVGRWDCWRSMWSFWRLSYPNTLKPKGPKRQRKVCGQSWRSWRNDAYDDYDLVYSYYWISCQKVRYLSIINYSNEYYNSYRAIGVIWTWCSLSPSTFGKWFCWVAGAVRASVRK